MKCEELQRGGGGRGGLKVWALAAASSIYSFILQLTSKISNFRPQQKRVKGKKKKRNRKRKRKRKRDKNKNPLAASLIMSNTFTYTLLPRPPSISIHEDRAPSSALHNNNIIITDVTLCMHGSQCAAARLKAAPYTRGQRGVGGFLSFFY